MVNISIDAMGGDEGLAVTLNGAANALKIYPDIHFLLFGDQEQIEAMLKNLPELSTKSSIHHCSVSISMTEKPSTALRKGRKTSSMWCAIDAVKQGDADVAISAGNTGALMAMATFCLRTIEGIGRPAIAALWPSLRSEAIVLDVGATIGAEKQQLIDNAFMGQAMARVLFDLPRPKVGLLNIGVEEVKGLDEIKEAASYMHDHDLPFDYVGFIEGSDIGSNKVDVVVTEGFSGNIALKTAEGTAKQVSHYLKSALSRSLSGKLGYFFARTAFHSLRTILNPNNMNGGVFLGLNGLVIKSHGGATAQGFTSAILLAHDMVINQLQKRLNEDLQKYRVQEKEGE